MSTQDEVLEELIHGAWKDEQAVIDLAEQTGIPAPTLRHDANHLWEIWAEDAPGLEMALAHELLRGLDYGLGIQFNGKQFFVFRRNVWIPTPCAEIRRRLLAIYRTEPNAYGGGNQNSLIAGALRVLKDTQYRERSVGSGAPQPDHVINTTNGEVRFSDDGDYEVRPNRLWSHLTAVSPVSLSDDSDCPLFSRMVGEIFSKADQPEEMILHVEEIMAYAMQPRRDIPMIIFLRGGGSNGKSVLMRILAALLGQNQVYWGKIETLSRDRFSHPALADKLLFLDDDARDGVQLEDGLLKSIAEAKPLMTRKAHDPESVAIVARALPIISLNGSPRISDSSYGFERRMYVIPFERRFETHEMDRQLADKIIATELPAIFNRLLDAYGRLHRRGGFCEPEECVRAKIDMLATANPVREFISEGCREAPGVRIRTAELWKHYRTWTIERGHRTSVPLGAFTSRLRAMGYDVFKSNGFPTVRDLEPVSGRSNSPPD